MKLVIVATLCLFLSLGAEAGPRKKESSWIHRNLINMSHTNHRRFCGVAVSLGILSAVLVGRQVWHNLNRPPAIDIARTRPDGSVEIEHYLNGNESPQESMKRLRALTEGANRKLNEARDAAYLKDVEERNKPLSDAEKNLMTTLKASLFKTTPGEPFRFEGYEKYQPPANARPVVRLVGLQVGCERCRPRFEELKSHREPNNVTLLQGFPYNDVTLTREGYTGLEYPLLNEIRTHVSEVMALEEVLFKTVQHSRIVSDELPLSTKRIFADLPKKNSRFRKLWDASLRDELRKSNEFDYEEQKLIDQLDTLTADEVELLYAKFRFYPLFRRIIYKANIHLLKMAEADPELTFFNPELSALENMFLGKPINRVMEAALFSTAFNYTLGERAAAKLIGRSFLGASAHGGSVTVAMKGIDAVRLVPFLKACFRLSGVDVPVILDRDSFTHQDHNDAELGAEGHAQLAKIAETLFTPESR